MTLLAIGAAVLLGVTVVWPLPKHDRETVLRFLKVKR